jgi:hypothetical protein
MPKKELQPLKIRKEKVRLSTSYVLAVLLLCCGPLSAAETQIVPEASVAPAITAEQPANPVSSKPGGPLIVSVSVSLPSQSGIFVPQIPKMIIPEFHFVAPNGNAIVLHSDLVETSANSFHLTPSVAINVPADAQKRGAVITHLMTCGQAPFYATMTAYIMDANGNRSNSVRYTLHCNGG